MNSILRNALACAAVFVVAAASAGAAQATVPTWRSGGAEVHGSLNTKSTFGETKFWHYQAAELVVVCKAGTAIGTITQESGKAGTGNSPGGLKFTGCKLFYSVENSGKREVAAEYPQCKFEGSELTTKAVVYKLAYVPLHEPGNPNKLPVEVAESFAPSSGSELAKWKLTGGECELKGQFQITGGASGKVATINTEAKATKVSFEREGTLKWVGIPMFLEATDALELESGALFGVYG